MAVNLFQTDQQAPFMPAEPTRKELQQQLADERRRSAAKLQEMRTLLEATLRERENRLHLITRNTSTMIALLDARGIYEFVNPAHKTLGYRPEELIGTSGFDLVHPEDIPHLATELARGRRGEVARTSVEYRAIARDGTLHVLAGTFDSTRDDNGELQNIVFVGDDITERKRTEAALRESEKKYRSILDSIEDGYYEVDLSGTFTFFNKAMADILGYTHEELLGMNNRHYMDARNARKIFVAFNHVYQTREPYKSLDWELIAKSGALCHVETSVSLRVDENGQPIGFQGIARDVTLRKQIEAENRALEKKLQRTRKMEAIGTLAGGVAHDLNNVLSGIVSYPDLILLDLPADSPLRKPVRTIQESGRKAADIVQDLLTLARRGVQTLEAVNLNTIVEEYLEAPEFRKLCSYHPDVTVKADLAQDLLGIQGSVIHLKKTIMNLVSNAAEAQPTGGTITLATRNRHLDRPFRGFEEIRAGDFVVLEVTDHGLGIAEEDMARVFEPFYTKKVMGRSGTGLGMAVVWGTVQDHEGFIDITSKEGVGTTFSLYFPVSREPAAQRRDNIPVEEYMGKRETVLVVDDVKEQREIAANILGKLNYDVATAASGEAAVAHVQDHAVDLLVLDMIMEPGIDGLETYRRILTVCPGQRAIIASGFSETDRVREAQRLGVGEYLKKPYTLERIGLAVKEELSKKRR
jgi:two-component system cell cycle sensor histidine kinase/response regulator CckA